eukprot:COSAG01_NODE_572_length_15298_cov_8.549172_11_plen_94_part_00
MGGGRSASHAPYPNLAGRPRGQVAIAATRVTGAALNSPFLSIEGSAALTVTADASFIESWLHRSSWRQRSTAQPPCSISIGFAAGSEGRKHAI